MDQAVKQKPPIWKEWNKGGCKKAYIGKETYIEPQTVSKRAVHAAKKSAEEKISNIVGREDSKKEIFKIAKQCEKRKEATKIVLQLVKSALRKTKGEWHKLMLRNNWHEENIIRDF